MKGYKPGWLVEVLGISRDQFCYWRRELDPMPARAQFSYQMLLCYAVLKELIVARWLEPRRLKGLNLADFFDWFEHPHSQAELSHTVIIINKHTSTVTFYSHDRFRTRWLIDDPSLEPVYLKTVETEVLARIKAMGT